MRLIPFLFFYLLVSSKLAAQLQLSPTQEIDYVKNILPVGELNGDLYTVVKHKKEVKLQVHAADSMLLKRELVLDLKKGGRSRLLEAAFIFDSSFVYVTSYANLSIEKRVLEVFKVVGDSVFPPQELATLTMKNLPMGPWREYTLTVDCVVSPDGKNFLMIVQNQQDLSSVNNRSVAVFDTLFRPVSLISTMVQFPANQSKIRFNIKDQFVLLNGGVVVQKTHLGVVVYTLTDEFDVLFNKPSSNYSVRSFGAGRLVISGLCSYENLGFMMVVYGDRYNKVIRQEFECSDASRFQVMDLLVKENREVTLVIEEVVRKQASTVVRSTRTNRQPSSHAPPVAKTSSVEFGDIHLINFSPNGSKMWEYKLGKQAIDSDPAELSSVVFSEDNLVYLLYNGINPLSGVMEGVKSDVQPMLCVIQEDGTAAQTPVFSAEQSALLVPAKCSHFKNGCFLLTTDFFCYLGK